MKTLIQSTLVVIAIFGFSTFANAETEEAKKSVASKDLKTPSCSCCEGEVSSPLIHALDIDKDGVITALEIKNAAASLKALDADGDGHLTRSEFHAEASTTEKPAAKSTKSNKRKFQTGMTMEHYVQTIYAKYDKNNNNIIEKSEMTRNLLVMLPFLDLDKNESLNEAELMNMNNTSFNYRPGQVGKTQKDKVRENRKRARK